MRASSIAERIDTLVMVLTTVVPGSTAALRGSRATGTDDAYSDVDLAWQVGSRGDRALAALPDALETVGPVESLRLDPDDAGNRDRRLVFVRFAGWTLFERVDLEVSGTFGSDPTWVRPWSPAESALMNAVAAVKAVRRGHGDVDGLLERGAARVGATAPVGTATERIAALAEAAVRADPAQRTLAAQVLALVR